jgi:3-hydroxyacyl-[acyl-carrier-protein] dehydratase
MLLNKEQIKEIIPHRDPFLLIDEVVELNVGKSITAIKYVRAEEYYFEGHFPQEKVMPGVLIIEALAQAGAVAILSMDEHKKKIAYFGGIKSARFRKKVVPGDVLTLNLTIQRLRGSVGTGVGEAFVDGKLACNCEILFAIGSDQED